MADSSVYHVVPRDDRWAVKREGIDAAVRLADSRAEAVREADTFIRNQGAGRVVVHKDDGTIESVHTFDTLPVETGEDWLGVVLSKPAMAVGAALVLVAAGILIARRS